MTDRKERIGTVWHFAIRTIAIFNMADVLLGYALPPYFRALGGNAIVGTIGMVSVGLLPLGVALEALWMRHMPGERKAIIVDGVLAAGWVVLWLTMVIGAFHRRAIL
jgi:uncharacterized membrane protein